MSDNTKIEWTDATWNIITGCSVVSAGCKNCYAMKLAGTRLKHHQSRAGLTIDTKNGPVWNGEVRFNEQWIDQPLRWSKPRMIFVCAHGDLFHESVPDDWIDKVFAVMALAKQHVFQVLTKRPERMRQYMRWENSSSSRQGRIQHVLDVWHARGEMGLNNTQWPKGRPKLWESWPLPNVWIGVSVENQEAADKRIPILLDTPAAVRWISAEPLLGPVDLTPKADMIYQRLSEWYGPNGFDPTGSQPRKDRRNGYFPRLDWVVVGGESGDGSRPMHPDWALSLRDQCAAAGVPFLFKQWGDWRPICEGGGDWYEQFYKSNRPAKDGEDQTALDDIYGKTCTVAIRVIHLDGSLHDPIDPMSFWQDTGAMTTFRVGKKAAGRLLDGDEHNGYPERSR
jgi:protein gp37